MEAFPQELGVQILLNLSRFQTLEMGTTGVKKYFDTLRIEEGNIVNGEAFIKIAYSVHSIVVSSPLPLYASRVLRVRRFC